MEEKCEACEKGNLYENDTWRRYKTPFSRRLCSEKPIQGTIFKCDNEECEEYFYNDEECEDLKQGYPC